MPLANLLENAALACSAYAPHGLLPDGLAQLFALSLFSLFCLRARPSLLVKPGLPPEPMLLEALQRSFLLQLCRPLRDRDASTHCSQACLFLCLARRRLLFRLLCTLQASRSLLRLAFLYHALNDARCLFHG